MNGVEWGRVGKTFSVDTVRVTGHVGSYPKGGIQLPPEIPTGARLITELQGGYLASCEDGRLRLWVMPGVEASGSVNQRIDLVFLLRC